MREFIDDRGAQWVAYAVKTDPAEGASRRYLPNDYQQGWLVFESGDRKLRLAPVPMGWREAAEVELRRMLAEARPTMPTLPNGHRAYTPTRQDAVQDDAAGRHTG